MPTIEAHLRAWAVTVTKQTVTPAIVEKLGSNATLALTVEKTVDVFTFTYNSGGSTVAGFLAAPKKINGKLPVIIFNRGGTADFGLMQKGPMFSWLGRMAQWGYIVIGTQYPGNAVSEGFDERGGKSDLQSILQLHNLLLSLPAADATKIGMYGISRGGMMTYLCMQQVPWITAALTVGGVTNLNRTLEFRPEMAELLAKHGTATQQERDARSVVKWANKLHKTTPLCIMHGTADWRVNVRDALELAEKLTQYTHPFSLHLLQGGDHLLTNCRDERDRIVRDWFDKYLKNKGE